MPLFQLLYVEQLRSLEKGRSHHECKTLQFDFILVSLPCFPQVLKITSIEVNKPTHLNSGPFLTPTLKAVNVQSKQ